MNRVKQFMGRLVAGSVAAMVAGLAVCTTVVPIDEAKAATYTNFVGDAYDLGPGAQMQYRLSATLDFSTTPLATNDWVDLIRIPSNTYVSKVVWKCTTAGTNTPAVDIGDYALSNRYGSALSLTGYSHKAVCFGSTVWGSNGVSVAVPVARLYPSNDAIRVRSASAGNVRTGAVKVEVLVEPFTP